MIIATDFNIYLNSDKVDFYSIDSVNDTCWTLTAHFSHGNKVMIAKADSVGAIEEKMRQIYLNLGTDPYKA